MRTDEEITRAFFSLVNMSPTSLDDWGPTLGVVVRKVTSPVSIKSFRVKASRADPRFVVKSNASGAIAAHTAGALHVLKRG